jgi:hypothetical protein
MRGVSCCCPLRLRVLLRLPAAWLPGQRQQQLRLQLHRLLASPAVPVPAGRSQHHGRHVQATQIDGLSVVLQ